MGQTLTHGIYLPDEGERNCYSGLAANWSILDGAVGTVAEHTSQIAGKAPLVHTHTKADITDFPAYGNTAGTICEGNDSRLSDARTPVAHTHTKSAVTDLLNSNFIPSVNNSYDLGSASKQWLNTYSKGYYYNGTAWGLDKANVWSADQTATGNLYIKSTTLQKGVAPSSNAHKNLYFSDKNGANIGVIRLRLSTGGSASFRMYGSTLIKDGHIDPEGTEFIWGFGQYLNPDGTTYFSFDGNIANDLIPTSSNYNLGTSSAKWKSLNGVNPGALSLPDLDNTYRWSLDTTNWVLDGSSNNTFTPNFSGWLNIIIPDAAGNYIIIQSGSITISNQGTGALASTITKPLSLLIPVIEGVSGLIRVNAASIIGFFYPALGNPIKTTQPSS